METEADEEADVAEVHAKAEAETDEVAEAEEKARRWSSVDTTLGVVPPLMSDCGRRGTLRAGRAGKRRD